MEQHFFIINNPTSIDSFRPSSSVYHCFFKSLYVIKLKINIKLCTVVTLEIRASTVASLKMAVFWDVAPCSLGEVY
jgi:hypothetical protein